MKNYILEKICNDLDIHKRGEMPIFQYKYMLYCGKGRSDGMNLKRITFRNFKSLYDAEFEPGKVNVFIGANGAGKSTILEAIGLLSAAMTDRVDDISLQRKGVRLSAPSMYKSRFKSIERTNPTVALSLEWEEETAQTFKYDVHLTTPKGDEYWKYHSETFFTDGEKNGDAAMPHKNKAIII